MDAGAAGPKGSAIETLVAVAQCLPDPLLVIDEDGEYLEVFGGFNRAL
jgi:hypothetical protein